MRAHHRPKESFDLIRRGSLYQDSGLIMAENPACEPLHFLSSVARVNSCRSLCGILSVRHRGSFIFQCNVSPGYSSSALSWGICRAWRALAEAPTIIPLLEGEHLH